MAIVTSGPFLGFSGTVDGITYFRLPDGRTGAKKKNRPSSIPPTHLQLVNRADTALVSTFMKSFKEFISVGYQLEAKKNHQNPHNMMVRYIRKNAIEGTYPNRSVNIAKVLVANGQLPAAAETSVVMTEQGLTFNWSTELLPRLSHHSDQVMMLAYFPEIRETAYVLAGAQRLMGTDMLPLAGIKKGLSVEVFISFITNDHTGISDSIYLGQFNW
jgi:hypothetical protein